MQGLGYAYSKSLRILSRGNTWKSFKCDRGPIFQVTNLNRNLTQFRPSEIHCQPDSTERNGSLRHLTTRNVFWSFRKATLESGVFKRKKVIENRDKSKITKYLLLYLTWISHTKLPITRYYSDGEYCHSFVIAAGDSKKYQSFVWCATRMCVRFVHVSRRSTWGMIWPLSTPNNFVVYGQKH